MQLSKSVKEQFVDGITFRNYLNSKLGRINDWDDNEVKCHMNDLDFLDETVSLVKDNPKVIKSNELIEPKLLKKMKEYFVKYDEDLTKRNVRSYISGYRKMCRKPSIPMYYFFTDEEVDNFVIECFDNDLGEILLPRRITQSDLGNFPFCFINVIHDLIDDFCEEMLSSDIKTITRKLLPIN
jgi:hypothetical protein